MSKNITIQEGGVAKSLTVDKLKTDLVGGGTCNWVPEDETQLITKSVTKNGTYNASSDGAYGYSKVVVNVAGGSVTGKGSDGNTHTYSVDDQDNIVDEVIPDTIAVTTPPTNPYGIYQNGQNITTEGMVVKAYNGDGTEYGTVPLDEITISPTTAVYDPSTDPGPGGTDTATSDISSIQQWLPVPFGTVVTGIEGTDEDRFPASPYSAITAFQTHDYAYMYTLRASATEQGLPGEWSFTYENKTVYYSVQYHLNYYSDVSPVQYGDTPDNNTFGPIAWTMIYGTIEHGQAGSRQTINVSWPRPGDGAELTTTFEILVAPGYTPGDNTEL